MLMRMLAALAAVLLTAATVEAKGVALVIGQNAYSGLLSLDNPVPDARSVSALLGKHGFEVIACDGGTQVMGALGQAASTSTARAS